MSILETFHSFNTGPDTSSAEIENILIIRRVLFRRPLLLFVHSQIVQAIFITLRKKIHIHHVVQHLHFNMIMFLSHTTTDNTATAGPTQNWDYHIFLRIIKIWVLLKTLIKMWFVWLFLLLELDLKICTRCCQEFSGKPSLMGWQQHTHTGGDIYYLHTTHTLAVYTGDFYIDLLHFPIRLHISKLRRAGEYWIWFDQLFWG